MNNINPYKRISPKRKPVSQYDLDGNFIAEYESITDASKKTKTAISAIVFCCKGQRMSANKFQWRYKEDG